MRGHIVSLKKRDRKSDKLYGRAIWRGPNGVRGLKLRRDPMCEVLGCTRPAAAVDHRIAHHGDFSLFCGGVNLENLRSLWQQHHDAKPERYEDGKTDLAGKTVGVRVPPFAPVFQSLKHPCGPITVR
jgi:5-methylcytosine-specific restriction endonuclease McrA